MGWLSKLVRYDKKARNYLGLLQLACGLLWYRRWWRLTRQAKTEFWILRASNIAGGRVVDADNVYVRCTVPEKLVLREGDILICSRSGSRNLIGKNARIDSMSDGFTFGAFMTIMRGPNNNYLHQIFNSKLFEHQSGAFLTSTINQLTLGILNDMKVPFPPAEEQQSILRHSRKATKAADTIIDRSRRQIELVEEYRTRLIADVVTGKLDVRNSVPVIPQEG